MSTSSQDLALQVDALKMHGVVHELIFTDTASGMRTVRPGLDACFASLKPGDVLLVWRLDRLGRSVSHLVNIVEQLRQRGVGFRSLCDGAIDTTTATGELVFHIFSALAQFERRLIVERTKAGLEAARARGRSGGRPSISARDPRVLMARTMHENRTLSIAAICESLRISRATFYRYLALAKLNVTPVTGHDP